MVRCGGCVELAGSSGRRGWLTKETVRGFAGPVTFVLRLQRGGSQLGSVDYVVRAHALYSNRSPRHHGPGHLTRVTV